MIDISCSIGPVDESIFFFDFGAIGCLTRILWERSDPTRLELTERLDQRRSGYESKLGKK